ncbi:unnamed protein product [Didymodactylos carnosus]|uniref:Uncharacterized protein n=1 Tax=Didymodactylos carnosus TaxID=1234261 RepID=A0A814ZU48_9BILA|nr:unnamed protein product [Didymodactylos carnosus]CAF1247906.1 unnamed protein product [Didymodactylos carnosus]CAF3859171.1 unnamed protein product [Didymodactylos carnosus]CAF4015071.1 unnamed protein product [Didymodactylos carnosus]
MTSPKMPVGSSKNDDALTLKTKITELERQNSDYKTKLDELRRAKATTMVKVEKEYVNTSMPGLNRPEKPQHCDKCDNYEHMLETEKRSNQQLKKMVEQQELKNLNKEKQQQLPQLSEPCKMCPDLEQLLEIEKQNTKQLNQLVQNEKVATEDERSMKEMLDSAVENMNGKVIETKNLTEALKIENKDFKNAIKLMQEQLHEKMDDLWKKEEEAKKQIAAWEKIYREWMTNVDRRVDN